jgi:hypothetical protein
VLGRLGGDEFAVLLPEAGPGELRAAAARLEQRLGAVAAASIGLAALPVDGLTAEDLHRAADADLYRAKQRRSSARRRGSWLGAQRPRDHHLLDLVGALADGEDLRVAVEAAHRVLLDVAVAAVDLDGLLGAAHRQAPGLELGLRGGQREVLARVLEQRRPCR